MTASTCKKSLNSSSFISVCTFNVSRRDIFTAALAVCVLLTPAGAAHAIGGAARSQFWRPEQLNLSPLRDHDARSNPYGEGFDYAAAFKKLNLKAVKKDISEALTASQDWWPADWGNYGPFFIRMAWHSAGTYRVQDGRGGGEGGQQRLDGTGRDNDNLDKARRLLWPVKQKYGRSLSWGDLMVLAGNVAMENMGFETYGFAGGRADDWEPESHAIGSKLRDHEGNTHVSLPGLPIALNCVNPQGILGNPNPIRLAKDIRKAFARMAMNDEETIALVAGGHSFGKMHGASKPECLGKPPGAAPIEDQGFGWKNTCGKGHSEDTTTSGIEGAWTQSPTQWSSLYLNNLLNYDWVQTKSPAGAVQWVPKDKSLHNVVADAHVKGKTNPLVMNTADMAFKADPQYRKIVERFQKKPDEFKKAFSRVWFKLTHIYLGPKIRYVDANLPAEEFIWQDPIPKVDYTLVDARGIKSLKQKVLASGLGVPELVRAAWASASSFRNTDMRGGANGGRLRLEPQKHWQVNNPDELARVLEKLQSIQVEFNKGAAKISMADLIVLAGSAAIEKAAKDAGSEIEVPFTPGRVDASQEQTDVNLFAFLEPSADAFRNYYSWKSMRSPIEMLVDKADLLSLSVSEMTVLVGGMRALDANTGGSKHGVFTDRPGVLTNDFFTKLLDMSTSWRKAKTDGVYEGVDRKSGTLKYTATPVDLIFGSNAELRAVAEVYASADGQQKFVDDFVKAWVKVMQLDRFDLQLSNL